MPLGEELENLWNYLLTLTTGSGAGAVSRFWSEESSTGGIN